MVGYFSFFLWVSKLYNVIERCVNALVGYRQKKEFFNTSRVSKINYFLCLLNVLQFLMGALPEAASVFTWQTGTIDCVRKSCDKILLKSTCAGELASSLQ